MKSMRLAALTLGVCVSALSISAQVTTGTPAFGTFSNGPDVINIGNLNTHLDIPIINKIGRGLNFAYDLTYDSSVWYPVTSGSSTNWMPVGGWGWGGQINGEAAPGFSFNTSSIITYAAIVASPLPCGTNSTYTTTTFNTFTYFDKTGTPHWFNASGTYTTWSVGAGGNPTEPIPCPTAGPVPSTFQNVTATDGSGITLYYIPSSPPYAYVVQKNGTKINPPVYSTSGTVASSAFQEVDLNGNKISGSGGVYTDTAGNTALTSTSNASAHTVTLSFANTSGGQSTYVITYSPYNIKTNFGCSTVSGEYTSSGVYLPSSITLPDSTSTYQFTYEATPSNSGYVTGRIASVTLPSGNTITYAYTGGSNGITCADGSASGLTRTLNADSGSAAQTWTYTRSVGTGTSQTNVEDGLGNNLNYYFVPVSTGTAANYYETHRKVYNGAASGTPVLERYTCYNGSPATCQTTAVSSPISQIDTYETLDGAETHGATVTFNPTYETETEAKTYDFSTSATTHGAVLRDEKWTYSTTVPSLPITDKVYDGSLTPNLIGQTTYAYDQTTPTASSGVPEHTTPSSTPGNLTTETLYASSSQSYALTATYEDTGSILTSVTPNGTTTLGYDSSFVYNTSTSLPTPSSGVANSSSATYDTSNTGLPLTSTDANSQVTRVTQYDTSLRPTVLGYPDGGTTVIYYDAYASGSPVQLQKLVYQTSSIYSWSGTQYDGYGRLSRVSVSNGQPTNPYYQADTCYDANGNASFQSDSYQGNAWSTSKVCSSAGTTTAYDVLGRVQSVTKSNGETLSYTYAARAVKTVDENGVKRISQIDGLGRPTIVCEISGNPQEGVSPGPCGTDIPGTNNGFTTTYTYTPSTGTTTVTQGAQTRTFVSDWLGRPTSVTEPESGTTTYSYAYNSIGLRVSRTRPQANQSSPTTLTTTTTTQYDSLGRNIGVSYTDSTPSKSFIYDTSAGWGLTQSNIKGRLTWADVAISPDGAKTIFSYDAMGRVIMSAQCRPSTCGSGDNQMNYTYDLAGNMLTSTDGAGVTSTYTVSVANELQTLTSSQTGSYNPTNLISSMQNNQYGPASYKLGNGLSVYDYYDPLGRPSTGLTTVTSSGSWVYEFTDSWKGVQLQNSYDTVLAQTSTYGYDEFNRLASRTVTGGTPNYSYTYDRYGNRWAQTVTSGTGYNSSLSFSSTTNQVTTSGTAYDAAGNMTNDGSYIYNYDAEGRIVTVKTEGGATLATYLYDALGHRIQTVVGSANTEFVFNPAGQRVSTWNGATGAQIQGQYYWGAKPVAFYKGGQTYFQHQDWEGTERVRTTYNGSTEGAFASLPFGDALQLTAGSDNDAYHYGMLDHDYESDTEHAQFRQYSSAQGHWLSPDPYQGSYDFSNPQSFNRYVYVSSIPLSAVDPSGLNPCLPVSINPGHGGAPSGGAMSPFCHAANYGTGDGVGMQLLNDVNATAALYFYNALTTIVAPDGTTLKFVPTDAYGNGVWVQQGQNGEPGIAVTPGSALAEQYGLPSSGPMAMAAMDPTGTQVAPSNNPSQRLVNNLRANSKSGYCSTGSCHNAYPMPPGPYQMVEPNTCGPIGLALAIAGLPEVELTAVLTRGLAYIGVGAAVACF